MWQTEKGDELVNNDDAEPDAMLSTREIILRRRRVDHSGEFVV